MSKPRKNQGYVSRPEERTEAQPYECPFGRGDAYLLFLLPHSLLTRTVFLFYNSLVSHFRVVTKFVSGNVDYRLGDCSVSKLPYCGENSFGVTRVPNLC